MSRPKLNDWWFKLLPEQKALLDECKNVGLHVTQLMAHHCEPFPGAEVYYAIQIWKPDGTLWAEGTGESAGSIRRHIGNYLAQHEYPCAADDCPICREIRKQ